LDAAENLGGMISIENHRHCEERSDEAIHLKTSLLDCLASPTITDAFVIADTMTTNHRHCEERSDVAIHKKTSRLDCFAALANASSTESMTDAFVILPQ
jgi:hypothetical protein